MPYKVSHEFKIVIRYSKIEYENNPDSESVFLMYNFEPGHIVVYTNVYNTLQEVSQEEYLKYKESGYEDLWD